MIEQSWKILNGWSGHMYCYLQMIHFWLTFLSYTSCQLIEAKNGCLFTSSASSRPPPRRLSGIFINNPCSSDLATSDMRPGNFTSSYNNTPYYILHTYYVHTPYHILHTQQYHSLHNLIIILRLIILMGFNFWKLYNLLKFKLIKFLTVIYNSHVFMGEGIID